MFLCLISLIKLIKLNIVNKVDAKINRTNRLLNFKFKRIRQVPLRTVEIRKKVVETPSGDRPIFLNM